MIRKSSSIAWQVIVIVVVSMTIFTLFIGWYHKKTSEERVVDFGEADVAFILGRLQRNIEREYSHGFYQLAEQSIMSFGVKNEIVSLAVITQDEKVLYSTSFSDRGELASTRFKHFDSSIFIKSLKGKPVVNYVDELSTYRAYHPLQLVETSHGIRTIKPAVIFMEFSIAAAIENIRQETLQQATVLVIMAIVVCVAILWVIRHRIIKPLRHLVKATQRMAGSEAYVARVSGAQETRELAEAFNTMSGKIEQAFTKLATSEQRWSFALDASGDGVWEWDIKRDKLYFSPRCQEIMQRKQENNFVKPSEWEAWIDPRDREKKALLLRGLMTAERESYVCEYRIHLVDGSQKWVLERAKLFQVNQYDAKVIGTVTDIHQRKLSEHILEQKEQRYRQLFELAQEGVFVLDQSRTVVMVNKSACRILGYDVDDLVGQDIVAIAMRHAPIELVDEAFGRLAHGTARVSLDWEFEDGRVVYTELECTEMPGLPGEKPGHLLGMMDVSERRKAEEKIKYQALYDSLTDLPNRRYFIDVLKNEAARSYRHQFFCALMFIDLDNFKVINDSMGHPVGDVLLIKVAKRLVSAMREEDTLARLGGDEFVILLSPIGTSMDSAVMDARRVVEKVQQCISEPIELNEQNVEIGSSVGLVMFGDKQVDPHTLIKQADTAMYRAKERGKNTYSFFSEDMQHAVEKSMRLQGEIKQAIEDNSFTLYCQPQYDCYGAVVGGEILIRWFKPDGAFVSPADFIPVAEKSGLIVPLGELILRESINALAKWYRRGLPDTFRHLAINISPRQFNDDNFIPSLCHAIASSEVPSNFIELEITESLLLDNLEEAIGKMKTLRKLGLSFAIDDFGTGYSSLSYLKQLPISKLKIDQSFVRDVPDDINDNAIVTTIISMAHNLGMDIIAEGVETEEQVAFLEDNRCKEYQGYYFSRPLPLEQFEAILFNDVAGTQENQA